MSGVKGAGRIISLIMALTGILVTAWAIYWTASAALGALISPIATSNQTYENLSGLGFIIGFWWAIPGVSLAMIGAFFYRKKWLSGLLAVIGLVYIVTMFLAITGRSIRAHDSWPAFAFLIILIFTLPGQIVLSLGLIQMFYRRREIPADVNDTL